MKVPQQLHEAIDIAMLFYSQCEPTEKNVSCYNRLTKLTAEVNDLSEQIYDKHLLKPPSHESGKVEADQQEALGNLIYEYHTEGRTVKELSEKYFIIPKQ